MYNIATLNKISPVGLSHLSDKYTVCDDVSSASRNLSEKPGHARNGI